MGINRGGIESKIKKFSNGGFSLKTVCLVEPSNESVPINKSVSDEMVQVGNRQCQVNSILNLFGKLDKSGISLTTNLGTRLQGEISDILEIINSTDSFNFPNITSLVTENPSQAEEFLKENSFSDLSTTQKCSISILDLSFKFVSCAYITHTVNNSKFKFIRFKSPDILIGSDFTIFSIPTSVPHIKAAFIAYQGLKEEIFGDMRRDKTDLFYKIESMIKSVSFVNNGVSQFTVPAFTKKLSWIVPWIQGYEIPPQRDEKHSQYIKKCIEGVRINVDATEPVRGILNLQIDKGHVFTSEFAFCLTHTGLDRVLDMPLFVCFVEPKDWISS